MEATLVKKVVEGVIWPAADAGEVTSFEVRAEASRVRRGEGIAHRKAEGNEGVRWEKRRRCLPVMGSWWWKWRRSKEAVAIRGVQESILISEGVPTNAP